MLPSRLFSLRIRGLGSRYLCSSNMANLKGSALLILAEGAEEMEAVITADVLRRGKTTRPLKFVPFVRPLGQCSCQEFVEFALMFSTDTRTIHVKTVIGGLTGADSVVCSRSVVIKPDMSLEDAVKQGPFDAVILPGGLGGSNNLAKSSKVKEILQDQEQSGRIIGAICAAPTVLHAHGIGKGKTVTSHPSVKDKLDGYSYSEDRVVRDGNLVTSRGPGTAFEFGIELVRAVRGDDGVAEKLAGPMLIK
ncbi:protein/nucleic acid deglycase DJ-1-like isoform X1 [Pocillopora verrucosa]|uniref:protein/nucleic acid deglycase DJ-1-like isoform X1 n=1 Tax=Pocillopora verrucosa TaxID=203993 RepID=UPI0033405B4E